MDIERDQSETVRKTMSERRSSQSEALLDLPYR
jgi:hypothetical protein